MHAVEAEVEDVPGVEETIEDDVAEMVEDDHADAATEEATEEVEAEVAGDAGDDPFVLDRDDRIAARDADDADKSDIESGDEPADMPVAHDPMPVIDLPGEDMVANDDASPDDDAPAPIIETADQDDDGDSVAAKLRRIRAVVSQGREAGADPLYSEDEHADDFLADTHQELEAALAADDATELAARDAEDDDEISELLQRFGGDDAKADDPVAEDEIAAAPEDDDDEDDSLFLP